jgi:IS605 OrfB family transposase
MNLFSDWKLCDSVTVHREYVMFSFEKETETKKTEGKLIGIDCGINHLMADSEGVLYGSEVKNLINIIKRKRQGSKAYKRAKKTLSYYIHKTVKELDFSNLRLAVCEKLKGLKQGKKKNRSKDFRKTLSNWNYGELLRIIQMRSEENRVSFRTVIPYKTSQTCPSCSHTERGNRVNENFKCLKCGYSWAG